MIQVSFFTINALVFLVTLKNNVTATICLESQWIRCIRLKLLWWQFALPIYNSFTYESLISNYVPHSSMPLKHTIISVPKPRKPLRDRMQYNETMETKKIWAACLNFQFMFKIVFITSTLCFSLTSNKNVVFACNTRL